VALVTGDKVDSFSEALAAGYQAPAAQPSTEPVAVMAVRPSSGASSELVT